MDQDNVDIWIATYDEVGARYDTAQPIDALRKETVDHIRAAIEAGHLPAPELDLEQWLLAQFNSRVMPERDRRAQSLIEGVDYLLDAFGEDGAYVDPLLDQVHRLGDKTDKRLRLWTAEDWHEWAYRRLQKAAETSRKADEADAHANRMIALLNENRVRFTGDLFNPGDPA